MLPLLCVALVVVVVVLSIVDDASVVPFVPDEATLSDRLSSAWWEITENKKGKFNFSFCFLLLRDYSSHTGTVGRLRFLDSHAGALGGLAISTVNCTSYSLDV